MNNFWLKNSVILFTSLFMMSTSVWAQAQTCREIVQAALDATDEQCRSTGRNQACYGNVNLEATPQPGIDIFTFSQPGDIVPVSAVESLSLSSRVEEAGEWGIVLMQLQVNIPDTTPGQNVTFLLFGDVQITNDIKTNADPVIFDVIARGELNVYSTPSADNAPVTTLFEGDLMQAVGRDADGSWLRISESGVDGWVSAQEVQVDGDISLLNIIGPGGTSLTPMQAFYFKSGISDAPCAEAPDSGILVQTPQGVGEIQFTVNEVNVVLGSTVYLQAQPGGDMTTSVVEGEATITAGGVLVVAPEGSQVRVPLDNEGRAAGVPGEPEPYDGAKMAVLPIEVLLRDITIATPISEGTVTSSLLLTAGEWNWMPGTPSAEGCPAGMIEFVVADFTPAGSFQLADGEFSWEAFYDAAYGLSVPPESTFSSPEPNTYVMEIPLAEATWHYEARVIDSTHVEGQFVATIEVCTMVLPFEVTRVGD